MSRSEGAPPVLRKRLLLVLVVGVGVLGPLTACCGRPEHVAGAELCYDQLPGDESACAPTPAVSSSAWAGPRLRPVDEDKHAAGRLCETHFTSGPVRRATVSGEHDCCYRADIVYCPKGGRPLLVHGDSRCAALARVSDWAG